MSDADVLVKAHGLLSERFCTGSWGKLGADLYEEVVEWVDTALGDDWSDQETSLSAIVAHTTGDKMCWEGAIAAAAYDMGQSPLEAHETMLRIAKAATQEAVDTLNAEYGRDQEGNYRYRADYPNVGPWVVNDRLGRDAALDLMWRRYEAETGLR